MISGFKDFILRGNVIDLAVAVVIGAAFTAIVNVLVEALIEPMIGLLFAAESLDDALLFEVPTLGGSVVTFSFGMIIGAVINFAAVAMVVYFVFVVPMNHLRSRQAAPEVEPVGLTQEELLTQIRDLLHERRDGR